MQSVRPTGTVGKELRTKDLHDAPYIVVMVLATAGVLYASLFSHWLRGVGLVGLAMLLAAMLRAVLSERQAGLLAVRHRPFDVLCYGLLGAGIIIVGIITQGLGKG